MNKLVDLLASFEQIIEKAPKVPFSQRVVVDADQLLGYIDEIRRVLPDELQEARMIAQERGKILKEANFEAEAIMGETIERARKLVEESVIVAQARGKADEILEGAQKTSRDIRQGARDYADELLAAVEEKVMVMYQQLHRDREQLRNNKAG